MKQKIGIIGILGILILVVAVSGCTSSGTGSGNGTGEPQYKTDLQVSATSYDYFPEDGSALGGCDLQNTGNTTYTKVKIQLEIFDENGTSIANETKVIGKIKGGEEINWITVTTKVYKKGSSATATVINATPS